MHVGRLAAVCATTADIAAAKVGELHKFGFLFAADTNAVSVGLTTAAEAVGAVAFFAVVTSWQAEVSADRNIFVVTA